MLRSILFSMALMFSVAVQAESPEAKGLKIAKKMESANDKFVGETSDMKLVLIDAYKSKVTRIMKGKVKEVKGDGDKSISIFLNPKDVKGTKMLTHTHKKGDDDQWLFMPSLRRVKRISSRNKSSSFMGSEFSYEDLGSQEIEKYNHKWIKDRKTKKGTKIWILERTPKIKSGYSKQIIWVSQKFMNPIKIEYFDRKNELLKVSDFKNYQLFRVNGKKLYRASKIHMKNVQTKKESIISWANRKLGENLSDRDFSKKGLK